MLHTLFYSRLRDLDSEGQRAYQQDSARMEERARTFPGFVDTRTFVAEDGERLTVVRFESAEQLAAWAGDPTHRAAQDRGRAQYYQRYRSTVCQELRSHEWEHEHRGEDPSPRESVQGPPPSSGDELTKGAGSTDAPSTDAGPTFESLDPEDWEDFRALGRAMMDRMIDWQRDVRSTAAWRPLPDEIDRRFDGPLPVQGLGPRAACRQFEELVLPYPTGLAHPRWWGWAGGAGTPMGMLAAMLGAATNSVPGNFQDAAARVERQLLAWMNQAMGFPDTASGVVTSGGSEANLIGLAVARDQARRETGEVGLAGGAQMLLYASTEVHSSVFKAARLLGLGQSAVRTVPVDEQYRIQVDRLREQIARDRADGHHPFAVVGTAGTINTGSTDDLSALADLCRDEGLWFHVDGAFGALAAMSERTRPLVAGMERADSLAFDFHKWMSVNYEAGCVLVRDPEAHRESFRVGASYLAPLPRGTGSQADMAALRGIQLSRGFKALKPWMSLLEHGQAKIGRVIARNVDQTRRLADLIEQSELLECVAPVALNVVAFAHRGTGSGEEQDAVNRELLMRIQESGLAVPSSTLLDGRVVLRACLCNHRTRDEDLVLFVDRAQAILREILRERGLAAAETCS